MPEQCTHALKALRARQAQAVAERMHRAYLEQSVGLTLPVLFETGEEGSLGHSDTYLLVKVPREGLRGQLLDVKITGVEGERLAGEIRNSEFGIDRHGKQLPLHKGKLIRKGISPSQPDG